MDWISLALIAWFVILPTGYMAFAAVYLSRRNKGEEPEQSPQRNPPIYRRATPPPPPAYRTGQSIAATARKTVSLDALLDLRDMTAKEIVKAIQDAPFYDFGTRPDTGEFGAYYLDARENALYYWNGSAYVQIYTGLPNWKEDWKWKTER